MSVSDPVADMLTKIRNASSARHEMVEVRTSKIKVEIIKILKNEGYIKNFKKITNDKGDVVRIFLKYDGKQNGIIHGIKKLSKPGRRVYSGYKEMPRVLNGFGTLIVSTSQGVITGKKAKDTMTGGELICTVW